MTARTKTNNNDTPSDFIRYDEIARAWPIQPAPTRDTILRWSRHGLFPAFFRPGNQKADALFSRIEVDEWLLKSYAPFFAKRDRGGRGG